MNKARILLSGKLNLQYYTEAVEATGAEAVAGYLPQVSTEYDGLILCGGNDIDPQYYQEAVDGSVDLDKPRDELEFALLRAYVEAGKPVLGICRGHQLINVFFGGSLYQHLQEASLHTNQTEHYLTHAVTAKEDSVVGGLYGTAFCVNSAHHQGVKKLGEGLRATAWWMDRYVEAFEHETLPVLGVQWHPEKMCASLKREDTVDGIELLRYFVRLCQGEKAR